jgi:hypothetical protein
MSTTCELSAADLWSEDLEWDAQGIHIIELRNLRICRARNCDAFAGHDDDFCPRCRDEFDAVREMSWNPSRGR